MMRNPVFIYIHSILHAEIILNCYYYWLKQNGISGWEQIEGHQHYMDCTNRAE